jgi:non-heme chloroperoxidase
MPANRTFRTGSTYCRIAGAVLLLYCGAAPSHAQGTAADAAAAPRSHAVQTRDGVRLAVHEHGTAGAPSIVFIHGFSQSSHTWDGQVAELAREFHVVTYDMRGHGASDRPLDATSYTDSDRWADELASVIQTANLQRPVLVGWSYGGYVITDYIRKYGDGGLGGVVFVGSSTRNGSDEAMAFLTDEVLAIFGDVLSADPLPSLDATSTLAGMFTVPGSASWTRAFGTAMTVPQPIRLAMFSRVLDNDDVLARIRVPTLVVHGMSDRVVRPAAGEHTAATVPGATLRRYDQAGHAPHIDQPERFNRDLAAFVRSAFGRDAPRK